MPDIGVPELLIVGFIVLLLFGPGKAADIGSSLGKSIREFRRESGRADDAPDAPSAVSSATTAARSCNQCGSQNATDQKFCTNCGSSMAVTA